MRNRQKPPQKDVNPKRQEAKNRRGKGLMFLNGKNIDPVKWSQSKDPLFGVKGIERYRKI